MIVVGNPEKKRLYLYKRTTLNYAFKTGCAGEDWTEISQDKVQWRALVNTVMNLRVP
jgi:hypothetical protein